MIGIITGSGIDQLSGFDQSSLEIYTTKYGEVELIVGNIAGSEVAQISRHAGGHKRLSNHINHRANISALYEMGATAIISLTACGAVDKNIPLSSIVVFDDLYFPSNRLPDGTMCTFFDKENDPKRGHWIFERPFSDQLRNCVISAAQVLGLDVTITGCYGHVDGPRFNSKVEVAMLSSLGISAISQTAGPETVLCGELELPFALIGFVTDYANGIAEPQPVSDLLERVNSSEKILSRVITQAVSDLVDIPKPAGFVYRFEK